MSRWHKQLIIFSRNFFLKEIDDDEDEDREGAEILDESRVGCFLFLFFFSLLLLLFLFLSLIQFLFW